MGCVICAEPFSSKIYNDYKLFGEIYDKRLGNLLIIEKKFVNTKYYSKEILSNYEYYTQLMEFMNNKANYIMPYIIKTQGFSNESISVCNNLESKIKYKSKKNLKNKKYLSIEYFERDLSQIISIKNSKNTNVKNEEIWLLIYTFIFWFAEMENKKIKLPEKLDQYHIIYKQRHFKLIYDDLFTYNNYYNCEKLPYNFNYNNSWEEIKILLSKFIFLIINCMFLKLDSKHYQNPNLDINTELASIFMSEEFNNHPQEIVNFLTLCYSNITENPSFEVLKEYLINHFYNNYFIKSISEIYFIIENYKKNNKNIEELKLINNDICDTSNKNIKLKIKNNLTLNQIKNFSSLNDDQIDRYEQFSLKVLKTNN